MTRQLHAEPQNWALAHTFTISRGSRDHAEVIEVIIREGDVSGHGECVPYRRYDETLDSVLKQIEGLRVPIESGANREDLLDLLPPGAARNALDCALWHLESEITGTSVWRLAGLDSPPPAVITAYTLSLGTPASMAEEARDNRHRPLLKLKLGPQQAAESITAVRQAAPGSRLIVDANEAMTLTQLESLISTASECGVEMVEQPLPSSEDQSLNEISSPVPLGADESFHTAEDVPLIANRYQVVNIKLDKAGGLTAALAARQAAKDAGLDFMVGCMVGTSLAMAPAMMLTPGARFVDLDGPLLMAKDRDGGLVYASDGTVSSGSWGHG